jgi:hypothetical protein
MKFLEESSASQWSPPFGGGSRAFSGQFFVTPKPSNADEVHYAIQSIQCDLVRTIVEPCVEELGKPTFNELYDYVREIIREWNASEIDYLPFCVKRPDLQDHLKKKHGTYHHKTLGNATEWLEQYGLITKFGGRGGRDRYVRFGTAPWQYESTLAAAIFHHYKKVDPEHYRYMIENKAL